MNLILINVIETLKEASFIISKKYTHTNTQTRALTSTLEHMANLCTR